MTSTKSSEYIIEQIQTIIKQIKDVDYSRPLELFNGSSVGQHCRHIYDFYACVVSAAQSGQLDYAKRERSPSIETNMDMALSSFYRLQDQINELDETTSLAVQTDFQNEQLQQLKQIVQSSVGRELMYAYDHAIHHLAIVKIGLKENMPYITLNDKVGVAPSTLRHKALHH